MANLDYSALSEFLPDEGARLERLQAIREKVAPPTVVVLGKYNHGKSSLLNALAGESCFKVADVRETVTVASVDRDGLRLVDTPGLDADNIGEDDRRALRALRLDADIPLFVHNVKAGELDAAEADLVRALRMEMIGTGRRAYLVLSQIDEVDEETLDLVSGAIAKQAPDLPILPVSARSYQKGRSEGKSSLIAFSRFEALTTALRDAARDVATRRKAEARNLAAHLRKRLAADKAKEEEGVDALLCAKRAAAQAFHVEVKALRESVSVKFQGV